MAYELYVLAFGLARSSKARHVVDLDWRIVMVWLRAVLHDRPVSWACEAGN